MRCLVVLSHKDLTDVKRAMDQLADDPQTQRTLLEAPARAKGTLAREPPMLDTLFDSIAVSSPVHRVGPARVLRRLLASGVCFLEIRTSTGKGEAHQCTVVRLDNEHDAWSETAFDRSHGAWTFTVANSEGVDVVGTREPPSVTTVCARRDDVLTKLRVLRDTTTTSLVVTNRQLVAIADGDADVVELPRAMAAGVGGVFRNAADDQAACEGDDFDSSQRAPSPHRDLLVLFADDHGENRGK